MDQFGAVFGARWIGLPVCEAQHFEVGPTSMSVLSWDGDHPEIPVFALWNAASGPDLQEVPVL
jgi:probable phosphoglycerate mutase